MKLNELDTNKKGRIKKINLDEDTKARLYNLGATKNAVIKPLFLGPFKDPITYMVNGTMFALRNSDASQIEVEVL